MRSTLASIASSLAVLMQSFGAAANAAEIGGFAQVNYAARVSSVPCPPSGPCGVLLGDERFQLRGVGDLLFANDVFPKDWVALFTGRPLEYLKVGSDALKLDLHPGVIEAEIVVLPSFQPDRYPTGDRLLLPDP